MKFNRMMWPNKRFYGKQEEMIYSVEDNIETYVAAGNQLGKDYVAGNIAVSRILRNVLRRTTCRVITTSIKDDHLRVLWGEIGFWIQECKYPLTVDKGGPLIVNHRDIRVMHGRLKCPKTYLRGMVSETGEGMSGHHAYDTLIIGDESSGIHNLVHEGAQGWAKRFLYFGNTWDCTNFFRKAIDGGDLPMSDDIVATTGQYINAR